MPVARIDDSQEEAEALDRTGEQVVVRKRLFNATCSGCDAWKVKEKKYPKDVVKDAKEETWAA